MTRYNLSSFYLFAALSVSLTAFAPMTTWADATVEFKTTLSADVARNGETTVLEVSAKVPSGYHLYSMNKIPKGPKPLSIKTDTPALSELGNWHMPAPKTEYDKNFELDVEYFDGTVIHKRAFKVNQKKPGNASIQVSIRGQICDEHQCITFSEKPEVSLTIEAGEARPDRTGIPKLEGAIIAPDSDTPPMGKGLLGFLIIAFVAGLGALATPCVFPMIPITISFFSKYSKVSMRRSVLMASIYAGAIILTFTLIGITVSMIFGAVGMQVLSTSAWFNIFLTVLLIVFAFNLFGLFEIQIPGWLISQTSQKQQSLAGQDGSLLSQAGGVFFMAITFTLVSFTCTVGFIGVVIASAAEGNAFYPAIGMLTFALAFSLPFFFLAIFPSWANKLQGKGGDWMVAVKATFGFIELAAAFKFLSNVDLVWKWDLVSRPFVLTMWCSIFLLAGLYLLRIFNLPSSDQDKRSIGPIRMFFALLMLAIAGYSFTGIRSSESMGGWLDGWLPPAEHSEFEWIVNDIEKGMEEGKTQNKPLFIDFTGYTCTNCRYMESAVFPKEDVKSRLKKMVMVEAFTDGDDDVSDELRDYQIKRFKTAALPFYAIIDPHTDIVLATFASSTNDVNEYIEFLDKGLDAFVGKPKTELEQEPHDTETQAETATQAEAETSSQETDSKDEHAELDLSKISVELKKEGKKVDFEFVDLKTGKEKIKLSSLRGQWVFVNLWASWCAPCRKELKNDFPSALKNAPHIKMLTVTFEDEDTVLEAREFAKETNMYNYISLLGPDDVTEAGFDEQFEVSATLPLNYLIHPDGHIAWKRKGSINKELLSRLFKKLNSQ